MIKHTQNTNGWGNGAAETNSAGTFTFSTGITVKTRKVSPFLLVDLTKALAPPKPRPPRQEITLVDGTKRLEENLAHPDYLDELEEYDTKINELQTRILLRRGIEVDLTVEDVARVQALRDEIERDFGTPLTEKDNVIAYIKYVCVGDGDDIHNLIQHLTDKSQPTEEAVTEAVDSFRSDV